MQQGALTKINLTGTPSVMLGGVVRRVHAGVTLNRSQLWTEFSNMESKRKLNKKPGDFVTNRRVWTTGGLCETEWVSFLITNGQSSLFADQCVLAEANK